MNVLWVSGRSRGGSLEPPSLPPFLKYPMGPNKIVLILANSADTSERIATLLNSLHAGYYYKNLSRV